MAQSVDGGVVILGPLAERRLAAVRVLRTQRPSLSTPHSADAASRARSPSVGVGGVGYSSGDGGAEVKSAVFRVDLSKLGTNGMPRCARN